MVSVVSAVKDLARLREISVVLVRHGFGEVVARAGLGKTRRSSVRPPDVRPEAADVAAEGTVDPPEVPANDVEQGEVERARVSRAERVRLVLQDLGPSFIKLGQIASTRADVLPPDVIGELKKLQDEVPAVPFSEIALQVEASLGPLGDRFVRFDERPLATASIGQVHRAAIATDEGEREVVVKVQRPGASATVMRDLELLHVIAAAVERALPETRIYSPVALVQQFDRSITSELNFQVEADNAERFAQNFEGRKDVRFPKVFRDWSSKHVLTLEYFDGKKIDRAVSEGAPGPQIARAAVAVVIKMIFEDGFFHADPHPGNIIILGSHEAPVIGLIDLGMVGRLTPELRERTVDLMVAAVRKDAYAAADALYAMGRPTRKIDMREYRAEVAVLAEKYFGRSMKEIDLAAMIRDLVQAALRFGIEIPSDFMLVGKALMTIDGIGKQIDPELDVYAEARPYFLELLRQRYSPQRLGTELIRGVEQISRVGYDLPVQLREVLEDLRLGRLSVRMVDPDLPRTVDRLGRRVFSALVIAALLGSGAALLQSPPHATLGVGFLALVPLVWLFHVLVELARK